ncbi:N/A [soil metagenome]
MNRGARTRLTLTPLRGLAPNGEAAEQWLAIDADPQFELTGLERFAGSWVRMTVAIDPAAGWTSVPALHLDCGAGYPEQPSVVLPQPRPGTTRLRFIFLVPADLKRARFDPLAQAGAFRLGPPIVRALSTLHARVAMLAALVRSRGGRAAAKAVLRAVRRWRLRDGFGQLSRGLTDRYAAISRLDQHSYGNWIAAFEPPVAHYEAIGKSESDWAARPLISIVMPVYNPPADVLTAALESVLAQVYANWELCIADDASDKPHVREILDRFASAEPRIKVEHRRHNGHIVAASNSALALATGRYVALMDHDDLLHPLALHFVGEALDRHPRAAIVFSDEDKLDESGRRHSPYFKSDFNYELFLSQNMVSHLGVYRRDLVTLVGGFHDEYRGSQDYDLALRVIEQIEPDQIVHVPRVLYHWRAIAGSTALGSDEKPYAVIAARRAIADHLERIGVVADVRPAPEAAQYSRVRHALASPAPRLTIVLTTNRRSDRLARCVESLFGHTAYPRFDVVIVDDGTGDAALLAQLKERSPDRLALVRSDGPSDRSTLINRGVAVADGDIVCLLASDIEITHDDWLDELASFAARPDIGAVGARIWSPDDRLQHAGILLGLRGVAGHAHRSLLRGNGGYFGRAMLHQQMSAVSAACLAIRRTVYQEVGGLDKSTGRFDDIDLCLRVAQAGYRNIWTPFAEMVRHASPDRAIEASQSQLIEHDARVMRDRWASQLAADPAYSPNLTVLDESFDLAWPPRLPHAGP